MYRDIKYESWLTVFYSFYRYELSFCPDGFPPLKMQVNPWGGPISLVARTFVGKSIREGAENIREVFPFRLHTCLIFTSLYSIQP